MFENIPTEMITAVSSAGLGAAIKLMAQSQANKMEMYSLGMKSQRANDSSANQAAAREGNPWARHFVTIFVITCAFGGLIYAASQSIPVTHFYETEVKNHLFGLLSTGGKTKTIEANGLALVPYVSHSVSAIVFFLFGAGAAKMSSR
jgi:hypothetical protein